MNMIRCILALVASCALMNQGEAALIGSLSELVSQPFKERNDALKVLIVHDQPGVVIEVKGKYKLFDPNTGNHITTRYNGKRRYMQPLQGGIKWGEEFPGIFQLVIVPDEESTTTLVDGIEYRGWLYVYDIGGTMSVVNSVDFTEYLSAIMSVGLQKGLPDEVLAAIAIALRTQAYYQMKFPKSNFWAIDAKQVGYQGHALVDPASPVEKAINATRQMVMSQNGAPIGQITPFGAEWPQAGLGSVSGGIPSEISLDTAVKLSDQGAHAAQILLKAFPNTNIQRLK